MLNKLASIIDYRRHTARFTTPTEHEPGVLLLLEDAHMVFDQAELAELGEHIALTGPGVCVALVATAETLDLDSFSGHSALVAALSTPNAQLFSEQAFAQLRVHRSRVP